MAPSLPWSRPVPHTTLAYNTLLCVVQDVFEMNVRALLTLLSCNDRIRKILKYMPCSLRSHPDQPISSNKLDISKAYGTCRLHSMHLALVQV